MAALLEDNQISYQIGRIIKLSAVRKQVRNGPTFRNLDVLIGCSRC